jgi:ribosome hibernation promoting factor
LSETSSKVREANMRLELRSRDVQLGKPLRDSVERRLRFVLGRFASRISRVTVYLWAQGTQHRDAATGCRIVVRLSRKSKVRIEDTGKDLDTVANRAVDRAGESVRRELERLREHLGRLNARA